MSSASRAFSDIDEVPHTRVESQSAIENVYTIETKIGQGSFGKVYKVTDKKTGLTWAMKCIQKHKPGSEATWVFDREVEILKRVKHVNIIVMREVFETQSCLFIILEYCSGGELGEQLKKFGKFPEPTVKEILSSLLSALAHLHKCDVVHRDLKLSNILLMAEMITDRGPVHIKVTDFGLSAIRQGSGLEDMLSLYCGTLSYMAPEIAENKSYSQQCDVWATGITAYQLFCGKLPFVGNDEKEVVSKISGGKLDFSASVWGEISEGAKDLVTNLLQVDPSYRLTASEAIQHYWFTKGANENCSSEERNSISSMSSSDVANLKQKKSRTLTLGSNYGKKSSNISRTNSSKIEKEKKISTTKRAK
ncbi:myosin light chain kinase A-like [Argonauta hians]